MTWIMLIVLYTGELRETSFNTFAECETALMYEVDSGRRKKMSIAECQRIKPNDYSNTQIVDWSKS